MAQLKATFTTPIVYQAAVSGTAGGNVPAQTAGQFLILVAKQDCTAGTVTIVGATDAGVPFPPQTFPCLPSQTLEAAMAAWAAATWPGNTVTITYA